nr:dephospho-CoA kinase [Hydrogenophaga crassostreae]
MPPLKLGLTGGIGSGKSTVAATLRSLGACVVDADAISRATTQAGGAAMPQIAQRFGRAFVCPDGSLDRTKMREHIFSNPSARGQLEAIIHPLVAQAIQTRVNTTTARSLVFDLPLLVESPRWRQQLDFVWVVDCAESTQIARVESRSGWSEASTRAVIDSQSLRSIRLAAADAVLFNEQLSLLELEAVVKQLADKFGL